MISLADRLVLAVAKPPYPSFLLTIPSFLRKQEPPKLHEIPGQARNEEKSVLAVAKPPYPSFLLSIPSFLRKQEPPKLHEIPGQTRNGEKSVLAVAKPPRCEVYGALASAGTCGQSVCMPSYRYHTACSCGMIAIRQPGDSL